jgi:YesN/AraC family two-component response regulator
MQLMYSALEYFFIYVYRNFSEEVNHVRHSKNTKEDLEEDIVRAVIKYMEDNLDKKIRFDDIYKKFFICRTQLKVLFKKATGTSVICFFNTMKMEEAKRLIQEQKYNFTQIGNMLGFDTVHYFSTSFKKHWGMSPTEYYASVKAELIESKE